MPIEQLPDTSNWPELGPKDRNTYRVSDAVVDIRRPLRPSRPIRLPALPQSLIVDLDKVGLIVIDMQNDFCSPKGWVASLGVDVEPARALAKPINNVTASLRAGNVPVIWLNWGVRADRLNLSPGTQHPFNPNGKGPGLAGALVQTDRSHNVLQQGSWGARIIDELEQAPNDIYVDKHRISGFWDTPLNSILSNLGLKTLVFAGVNADHCVMGTLMDANFHGYDTILLEDCTATTSPSFCMDATLHNVRFCFGFTVKSGDFVDAVTTAH